MARLAVLVWSGRVMARYPITAYSLCTALGTTTKAAITRLSQQQSGLKPRPLGSLGEVACGVIAETLDPVPRSLGTDTRQHRIAWAGVRQIGDAIERCCARWTPARVGIVIGTSTGGIEATEQTYAHAVRHGSFPAEFDLRRHHAMQATVELVRAAARSRGPAYVVSTACSSSAKAIASAQRLLDGDAVDAVIVGGVDSLCELTLRGFASLEVISMAPCRPFSSERCGINLGEGAGFLVLERRGEALVELVSVGESNDAHHMSAPHPTGLGARLAMERALRSGGVAPEGVRYVNAHATGTILNDLAEAQAIRSVFGSSMTVVGTKAYTGHTLGAAGAIEAVVSVVSIEQGWIPASLGSDPVDLQLSVTPVVRRTHGESDYVLSNSFAFGGSNAAVLLGARTSC
jgi:3-oxoacyl-[acyl-carrier-protein] synthase-1